MKCSLLFRLIISSIVVAKDISRTSTYLDYAASVSISKESLKKFTEISKLDGNSSGFNLHAQKLKNIETESAKIIAEKTEEEFQVMIPESKLDEYISNNSALRRLSYRTTFHKLFKENIDAGFPYQDLTLEEIGIPLFDVIQVSTEKGMFYVELAKDTPHFL